MQIRPYCHPDDERSVLELWSKCGLTVPWNDPRKDIARKLRESPALFLVGLVEGRVVATVMAGYEGHRGSINYLAVDPAIQRQGLGRAILNAAEHLLMEQGCPKINLQVRDSNLDAIGFYRTLGYEVDPVVSLGKRLIFDG